MTSAPKRSIFDDDDSDESGDEACLQASFNEEKESETKTSPETIKLTATQKARMEQNRQKALLIKRDKMNRKMPKIEEKKQEKVIKIDNKEFLDSGGGFFIEKDVNLSQQDIDDAKLIVADPEPLFGDDRPICGDCGDAFNHSYLLLHFNHSTCDDCRDIDDKHRLITKTDARNEYLLKDVDLDVREPPLKFIVRKNPHNARWGDMKLYLKLQVEKRALDVWGSEEAIEQGLIEKAEQQDLNKKKKFDKKLKELRMNVRSSLYTRINKVHTHEYGEEIYLPDEDEYMKKCKTCNHSYTYDKM